MIGRRKLSVAGAAALAFSSEPHAACAQPRFADIAGEWSGSTEANVLLDLIISAEGLYMLRFLTGPAGGSIPRGRATWINGLVILKYGDTEISLTRSADGKLVGPYQSPRGRGFITFSPK